MLVEKLFKYVHMQPFACKRGQVQAILDKMEWILYKIKHIKPWVSTAHTIFATRCIFQFLQLLTSTFVGENYTYSNNSVMKGYV